MGRGRRAGAEVLGGLDNAHAENRLPDPVHGHARCEGRTFVHQPAREGEPRRRLARRQRVQRRGHLRGDPFFRIFPSAPIQPESLAGLIRAALGEMKDGRVRLGELFPQRIRFVVERFELRHALTPRGENLR